MNASIDVVHKNIEKSQLVLGWKITHMVPTTFQAHQIDLIIRLRKKKHNIQTLVVLDFKNWCGQHMFPLGRVDETPSIMLWSNVNNWMILWLEKKPMKSSLANS